MLGRRSRACYATSCPTHAPGQDYIREDVVNRPLIQFGDPREADGLIVASSLLAHLLPFPDTISIYLPFIAACSIRISSHPKSWSVPMIADSRGVLPLRSGCFVSSHTSAFRSFE